MIDGLIRLNSMVRAFVWGVPMLVLLVGTGVYFTLKTGVFQLRYLGLWLRKTIFSCFHLGKREKTKHSVSPFATMCTALAATVGTGNIAGVATALTLGGPGAVFWMWVSGFFGMMTAFAENTLGMLYRERSRDGSWRGGPMLYLRDGFNSPFLAGAFSVFCVLASFGIGNMSQCNSISDGLYSTFGIPPLVTGMCTACILGMVMLGGLKRVSRIAEILVPIMAAFYISGAAYVLMLHRSQLLPALTQIINYAFAPHAGLSGIAGYGVKQAVRVGVSRGIFSNEAGLGSSVMVHAAANVTEPCEQGMWAVFEVFFDTVIMCTVTALVILVSGVYDPLVYGSALGTPLFAQLATGVKLTAAAFSTVFGNAGGTFVSVSLALFAFSTLLGWSFYGQRAAEYLFGEKTGRLYRAAFVLAAGIGCVMRLDLAWALSDTFNGLMALPNLAGVLMLRKEVLREWGRYRGKL